MSSDTSFALTVLSAVFAGVLGFIWWFLRDSLQRLEARNDRFAEQFAEFRAESAADSAVLESRLTLFDAKIDVIAKKSEEHGAALLLLMPRLAVLEEEEQMRQRRDDLAGPHASTERSLAAATPKPTNVAP